MGVRRTGSHKACLGCISWPSRAHMTDLQGNCGILSRVPGPDYEGILVPKQVFRAYFVAQEAIKWLPI